jgi:hypothetical protein
MKTGRVTFINESSYSVKVHRDSFGGPVVVELGSGTDTIKTVNVRISDSHGFGTTFSVEYLFPISDELHSEGGEILASMLDFDVQINLVIQEGRSYTVQIPQPKNLEPRSAFIELYNSHNLPCELRYYGLILRQEGSGNIPIPSGRFGIYKLDGIPVAGEPAQGYRVVSTFSEAPIPEFTIQNGYIYKFNYDGTSVVKRGDPWFQPFSKF